LINDYFGREICISSQKTNARHGFNLRASEQRRRSSEWKLVEENNNNEPNMST
jgi:hypothetical protein